MPALPKDSNLTVNYREQSVRCSGDVLLVRRQADVCIVPISLTCRSIFYFNKWHTSQKDMHPRFRRSCAKLRPQRKAPLRRPQHLVLSRQALRPDNELSLRCLVEETHRFRETIPSLQRRVMSLSDLP